MTARPAGPPPVAIRPATVADLPRCQEIWAATGDVPAADAATAVPNPLYAHELATGRLLVAERVRTVVGFGAALPRGDRWFLADLFVDPSAAGAGAGRRLLADLAAGAPARRATLASDEPAAQALYARIGMAPRWPAYYLHGSLPAPLPQPRLRAVAVAPTAPDPHRQGLLPDELVARDAQLSGVRRPADLTWWAEACRATPLWLVDEAGAVRGHAFVQDSSPAVLEPASRSAATIVTVRVDGAQRSADAVLAALAWAEARRCPAARLLLPGPHPALVPLLEAGFRIVGTDVFCASDDGLFDPARDVPSATLL
jgi:GNAT superfamily N-acetyltransferase